MSKAVKHYSLMLNGQTIVLVIKLLMKLSGKLIALAESRRLQRVASEESGMCVLNTSSFPLFL